MLDLTSKKPGEEILVADIEEAERKLDGYRIKELDIVLLRTDAVKKRLEKAYLTDHPGMPKEGRRSVLRTACCARRCSGLWGVIEAR